jgi:hypothetical protein
LIARRILPKRLREGLQPVEAYIVRQYGGEQKPQRISAFCNHVRHVHAKRLARDCVWGVIGIEMHPRHKS